MKFLLTQRLKINNSLFCILFYFYSSFIFSQNNYKQIDLLLSKAKKESRDFQFEKSNSLSKQALYLSKKNNYKKGICESYYNIAYYLCNIGKYDESFKYLDILEKDYNDIVRKDLLLNRNVIDLKGRNYLALGFIENAKTEFKKELEIADLRMDKEDIYRDKISAYIQLQASSEEADSMYYYLCKTLPYYNKIKNKEDYFYIYSSLADYHITETKSLDSAFYHNNRSLKISLQYNDSFLYVVYLQKADILFLKKNYKESLKYAEIALKESIAKNRTEQVLAAYRIIADNQHFLKNTAEELKNRNEYVRINDSMTFVRNKGKETYTQKLVNEKEQNISETKRIFFWASCFILVFIILGILWFLYSFKKLKHRKRNIINTREKEIDSLRTKLKGDSREDLIILAQTNSPDFLLSFKEVYPEFIDRITSITPDLITSELVFCAYLKLNFSTKDIATYTFVTAKAIQNRKNRIRKRLNIPSDADIYIWINDL
ncbi:hypothetical protein HHL23_13585 [Chryseobacterium sp. RP-3-3]|uniref:HTH luxR-type domain-containing protein n=1 Tax=Chryseobacterium antibioticum TaxID=2728847 RepID=A0A7Y0AP34_9FLAO|nr:hypothetical protein [Chryseobacterium antibioticum]NML70819.1 hypothetical protein [Chryseobacterium antibioticum]